MEKGYKQVELIELRKSEYISKTDGYIIDLLYHLLDLVKRPRKICFGNPTKETKIIDNVIVKTNEVIKLLRKEQDKVRLAKTMKEYEEIVNSDSHQDLGTDTRRLVRNIGYY